MSYRWPTRAERQRRAVRAAGVVRRLREEGTDASDDALSTLQRALVRGNVRDVKGYLTRIVRFETTGEWTLTRLDTAAIESEQQVVGGGRRIPWSGGRVVRSRSYD